MHKIARQKLFVTTSDPTRPDPTWPADGPDQCPTLSRDGTWSAGQRFWPGRVRSNTCQCVRSGVWTLTQFWLLTCAFIVAVFLQSNTISEN